jgi:polysaccharide pyruvyl transferase WcaK-like protein
MSSHYRKFTRNISLASVVETELLSEVLSPSAEEFHAAGNNIAIVGGELFNKGAQAMTFTVVDQLSRRYPEKEVYLLSGRDYERSENAKSRYNFQILPWGPEIALSVLSPKLNIANTTKFENTESEEVQTVLSECTFLIDINGYALSAQQGFSASFTYLTNIIIAKKYEIPMYVLPQSIGPFDYPLPKRMVLNPLLKTYLSYPEIICPREEAGVESLSPYTRHNVKREFDILLQQDEYDLQNIYAGQPELRRLDIEPDAVGIVPNSKVFERAPHDALYSLYEEAIEALLSEDRTVYILRHSVEDLNLCQRIKERFPEEESVVLIEDELNAIELEHVIEQFDFLIASRYHSIVHAYKNTVPVIAIGWAVKYKELLNEFEQSQYFFEGRETIEPAKFRSAVERLSLRHDAESSEIQEKLHDIQKDDLFERLFGT